MAILTSRVVFIALQTIMTIIVFSLFVAAESGEIQFRTFFVGFVIIWSLGMLYTAMMPWINTNIRIGFGIFTIIMTMLYINAL